MYEAFPLSQDDDDNDIWDDTALIEAYDKAINLMKVLYKHMSFPNKSN